MSGIVRARGLLGVKIWEPDLCTTAGCRRPVGQYFSEVQERLGDDIDDPVEMQKKLEHIFDTLDYLEPLPESVTGKPVRPDYNQVIGYVGPTSDYGEAMHEAYEEYVETNGGQLRREIRALKKKKALSKDEKRHLRELQSQYDEIREFEPREAFRLKYGRYPGLDPCCRQTLAFPRLVRDDDSYKASLVHNNGSNKDYFRNMRVYRDLPPAPEPTKKIDVHLHRNEDDDSDAEPTEDSNVEDTVEEEGTVLSSTDGDVKSYDSSHPSLYVDGKSDENLDEYREDKLTGVILKPGQRVIGYLMVGDIVPKGGNIDPAKTKIIPRIESNYKFEWQHPLNR